ncbi:hypothetical protein LAWI1_G007098 [Lachnellula willkommii]|uniref:Putative gamma-glutamylcyclotransferase n=1 Tax=Lachnellula willkommii TaxID=215461 RepID=A0A559M5W9_9HELO|nr:hypothetical protein LAWI1_G007098 [Lachnellula willkommii]
MNNFKESSSSLSTPNTINDEKEKPGHSLPTAKPHSHKKAKRNIMLEKFKNFQPNAKPSRGQYAYIPKPFFFYGSLTDPLQLQEVLQVQAPPVLAPARVRSYKIMLWGQYPALVDGPHDSYVDGMAYVVETEEQQKMLEHYETEVYSTAGIRVTIEGKQVSGRTFK